MIMKKEIIVFVLKCLMYGISSLLANLGYQSF